MVIFRNSVICFLMVCASPEAWSISGELSGADFDWNKPKTSSSTTTSGSPSPNSAQIEADTKVEIGKFRHDNRIIPPESQCERILIDSAQRLGRALTEDEIAQNVFDILQVTGESLVRLPGEPFCFTGKMKVLTSGGERPIESLRPGDEVLSFDLDTRQLVSNRIQFVTQHANQLVGRLIDVPRPIDVTARHKFFVAAGGLSAGFYPVEEISEMAQLLFLPRGGQPASAMVGSLAGSKMLRSVNRGRYITVGHDTVHSLELVREPKNFFVNGVLVHNGIKVCI